MIRYKISGMPAVDGEGHVIGIITEADLLILAGIPRGHVFNDIVMATSKVRAGCSPNGGRYAQGQ